MSAPVDVPSMAAPVDAPSMAAPVDAPFVAAPVDAPFVAAPVDAPFVAAPVDAPFVVASVDAPSMAATACVLAPGDGPSKAASGDGPSKVAPGPGLYSEVGQKARDLLNKDFHTDQKFTLTTRAQNGAAITATSTKKNEAILGDIKTQFMFYNVKVDVKATTDSQVFITTTTEDLGVAGLKKLVTIPFPNQTAGKVEVQYLHDYAGLNVSVGLNPKPLMNLSGVFGNKALAVGADVAYDCATGDFTKYNAGVSLTNEDLSAAVMLNNKGDSLTASYYHSVNKEMAVGAEVTHSFSSKENTFTFGSQYSLDPLTTAKLRYNNLGMVSTLIQHEWRPKSFLALSTEVDTKVIDKSSKIGLSLVLEP